MVCRVVPARSFGVLARHRVVLSPREFAADSEGPGDGLGSNRRICGWRWGGGVVTVPPSWPKPMFLPGYPWDGWRRPPPWPVAGACRDWPSREKASGLSTDTIRHGVKVAGARANYPSAGRSAPAAEPCASVEVEAVSYPSSCPPVSTLVHMRKAKRADEWRSRRMWCPNGGACLRGSGRRRRLRGRRTRARSTRRRPSAVSASRPRGPRRGGCPRSRLGGNTICGSSAYYRTTSSCPPSCTRMIRYSGRANILSEA